MKNFSVRLLGFLLLTGWLAGCSHPIDRLHIILIYTDDMGVGDASFSGGSYFKTPNLNRLAKQGKVFTQYYTPAPVCSPSRVSVFTGQYHIRWGINTFLHHKKYNRRVEQQDFLDDKAPGMAKMLKAAGYKTAHIGKWHMGGGRDVNNAPRIENYGFDLACSTWESPQPDPLLTSGNWIWKKEDPVKRWERTAYFVDQTLDFIRKNPNQSCFINLWPDDIHTPWVPDEESEEKWQKVGRQLPKLEAVMNTYDKEIGRLMDELANMGVLDNTLIIFTSDNGPAPSFNRLRTNGLRGVKNSLYEGGIRMPMIIHWPNQIESGQIDSTSILSSIDLLPTLASILGVEPPENLDGQDLKGLFLADDTLAAQRPLFFEFGRNHHFKSPKNRIDRSPHIAIRKGKWKLLTNADGKVVELYNLENDPYESKNVAHLFIGKASELKAEAIQWFKDTDKSMVRSH